MSTFEGSISGDTATGTFKYEQTSLSTGGGGGAVEQIAIGTFTVTLPEVVDDPLKTVVRTDATDLAFAWSRAVCGSLVLCRQWRRRRRR